MPLHVGRDAVDPLRARLVEQRHAGQLFDESLQRWRREWTLGLIQLVNRCVTEKPVGESRSVGHHFAHGRRVHRFLELRLTRSVRASVDLQVRKLGNVTRQRIVGVPLALLVQLHHGHAGNRLGHGVDLENGVLPHRHFLADVLIAVDVRRHDRPVSRDVRHDARQLAVVYDLLHGDVERAEPLAREADRRRRGGGEFRLLRDEAQRCRGDDGDEEIPSKQSQRAGW